MRKAIGVTLALGAGLLLPLTLPARAEFGELDVPRIGVARGFPEATATRVHQVFDRKDWKFAGGHYVNFWTSLRFSGDTKAVNGFIDELAKCPGVTVSVAFRKFVGEDGDWRVGHRSGNSRFQVEVNLDSRRINIENVVIPELKGPPLKQ